MKRIKYIIMIFVASFITISCDGWLEATSSTQIQANELFNSKSGFYEAISGVYIGMGAAGSYGSYYTWGLNDKAAYPFMLVTTDNSYYIQQHDYEKDTPKARIESSWSTGYNIIANINMIIRELDNHREVLSDEEYKLMMGEMLGLRAYIHFDIMRMFGLNNWDGENASKLTVPYVVSFNKEPTSQLSYAATAQLLLDDIHEALELLYNDPVTGRQLEDFQESINAEGFWNNRTKHLNYYAVMGLAARVYQWMNDSETAAKYAQDVIDGALQNGVVSWIDPEAIIRQLDSDRRDWTFSTEHLFSLEITDYGELTNVLFYNSDSRYTIDSDFINNVLYPPVDPVTGSVSGEEDIRGTALQMRFTSQGYRSYKLYYSSTYAPSYRNRMPMIKLSEMYYIIAENYIKNGMNAEALTALDAVRTNRGIIDSYQSTVNAEEELTKEYYREFILEGQLFYWLKHTNATSSLYSGFTLTADDLIYPYPDAETDYGRVQEL